MKWTLVVNHKKLTFPTVRACLNMLETIGPKASIVDFNGFWVYSGKSFVGELVLTKYL